MIHQMYYDSRHKERYTLSYMQPDRFLHLLFYLYASHLVHFLDLAWGVPSWVCLLLQLSLTVTAMVIIAKKGLIQKVETSAEDFDKYWKKQRTVSLLSLLGLPLFYLSIREDAVFTCCLSMIPYLFGYLCLYWFHSSLGGAYKRLKNSNRIEKLLDADKLAMKLWRDERWVAEEAEAQDRRRRIKEYRALVTSEEYLNRVFGSDRQVFDVTFGQVIVSFEKKMIRFNERDYSFSQIMYYSEQEYLRSRPTGQYESTSEPVQVISSKPNTASVIGRAAIGSQIGGFWGAMAGAMSAPRDYTVTTEHRTSYTPTYETYYKRYLNVKIKKENDIDTERLVVGESSKVFYDITHILKKIIQSNKQS